MKIIWIFALLVALGILLSYVNINLQYSPDKELYFKSYDTSVRHNESACFSYVSFTANNSLEVNGRPVDFDNSATYCVQSQYLSAGDNLVRLKADDRSIFFHVNQSDSHATNYLVQNTDGNTPDKNPLLMFIASFLVFLLPGAFVTGRLFKAREATEFLSLSIAFSLLITFIVAWLLNYFNMISTVNFMLSMVLISLIAYRKDIKFPDIGRNEMMVIAAFILLTLATQLCLFSHNSPWSVYYDRQVESTYSQNSLVSYDYLSYLGRPFTFVPGYILTNASFSWLSSTFPTEAFFVFQVIGNLFLLSSIFYLGRTLKFDDRKITIMAMFILSSLFIFGWLIIALLHLYALALFITALALALKDGPASSLIAGLSGLFHASFLIAFPILLFALQKKINLKAVVAFTAIAVIGFFAFYSPTIIQHGLPTEIQQEDWGYLIRGNVINLGTMSAGFMSLAVIPALYFGFKRNRKLTIMTLLTIAAFLLISYRVNFILAILVSVLFVSTFKLKSRLVIAILALLFIMSLGLNLITYNGESLDKAETAPFLWIKSVSANDSRILVEPFFGHISNYYSQRSSLADLYVEYASDEKYTDSLAFIRTGNADILKKWNISYIVTMHSTTILRIAEFKYYSSEIEFEELDKPYTNLYFNVHQRR
jgi:hypothetical protein